MGYAEGNTHGFSREDAAMESVSCSECPYFYDCDNMGQCVYEKGEN